MKVKIEIAEKDLKVLIVDEIARRLGDLPINVADVVIEVKSKQNYKSEWESAAFRAIIEREQ